MRSIIAKTSLGRAILRKISPQDTGPQRTPRQKEVGKKIASLKNSAKGQDLVLDTLTDDDLQKASCAERLMLLKTLRKPNVDLEAAGNERLLEAVSKLYKNMAFNPSLVQKDGEVQAELVKKLKDKVTDMKDKWTAPETTKEEKQKFLNDVLKTQCEAQKKASGCDVPVTKVQLVTLPEGEFGNFDFGPPRVISINDLPSKFDDFRAVLDTILHENTHSYQRALMDNKDSLTDEGLKEQAEVFALNTNNGYISEGDIYDGQPKEKHAWGFAGQVVDELMPLGGG